MYSEKNSEERLGAGICGKIAEAVSCEDSGGMRLAVDICYVLLGFLFGGCHLIFGAYPLGISLIAVLQRGCLPALIGAVAGALMLGKSGIIYALTSTLTLLLRIVISGGERRAKEDLVTLRERTGGISGVFGLSGQSLVVRTACGIIAGFISAIYEILLNGLSLTTVLFGAVMILSPAILIFVLSGFFDSGITLRELLFGGKRLVFPNLGKGGVSTFDGALLRISALSVVFLISFSLEKYSFFGVDLSLTFASAITLFSAKRFGAVYGGVCGFIASFGVSPSYSVAYVLAGIGAGSLFGFGGAYAVVAGGLLLSLWGVYVGGLTGILSVLVEYAISAACLLPVFGLFERERRDKSDDEPSRKALDMVGTMALAYRNKTRESTEALEDALRALSPVIRKFLCSGEGCPAEARSSAEEYYDLFARMFEDARRADEENREMDEEMTERLESVFREAGFAEGVIRAFGKRKKYLIAAGEDGSGELITSPRLIPSLEEAAGLRFSSPEYFRRGDMVLMECQARSKFKLEMTFAQRCAVQGEACGDSVRFFETSGAESFLLISDGMGSGAEARGVSGFACDFLSKILGTGVGITPALHGLNGVIREKSDERSVTVDLLCFDMLSGNAVFVKSAASPSFIKRGSSLFRIKSETMPLGLIRRVDAERISSSLEDGDVVVMISDGITDNADDAPWLLEILNKPLDADAPLKPLADKIISSAPERARHPDDMTVAVARVRRTD